ncbi:MAG TPA: DUF6285 domain-containing protein, partial [Casimicrobiaceae bacterium]
RGALDAVGAPSPASAPMDLAALRQAAGAAIRGGRFDEPSRAGALAALLMQTAVARVAISNPKALREGSADAPASQPRGAALPER